MRTALYAGLVAGSLIFHAFSAEAAESSSLRGLKPPRDAIEAEGLTADISAREQGLRWQDVDALQELAPRLSFYGGLPETRHFAAEGARFRTATYFPSGGVSSIGKPSAFGDIFPRYTVYRQLNQSLPGGWGVGLGVRQSEYSFATNSLYSMSAERYFGNFRGAYTLYSSRTDGNDLGSAQRVQLNYFYGDRNTIGLSYTTGRDIENLGMPQVGFSLNDARDVTLSGRHWLSTNWALTYDLQSHEQGTLYRRQGLRLGVSRSF